MAALTEKQRVSLPVGLLVGLGASLLGIGAAWVTTKAEAHEAAECCRVTAGEQRELEKQSQHNGDELTFLKAVEAERFELIKQWMEKVDRKMDRLQRGREP